jgi:hypothetical protein
MDNYVSGDTNNNNNPVDTVDALDRADGPEVSLVEAVYRGFPVRARRAYRGHWCGYITVPRAHPWARAACTGEDGAPAPPCESRLPWVIDVHGGCTYAEVEGDGDGDGDGDVTVGFDCAHMGDAPPPWAAPPPWDAGPSRGGEYRALAYVREQLLSLAEQAERAANV